MTKRNPVGSPFITSVPKKEEKTEGAEAEEERRRKKSHKDSTIIEAGKAREYKFGTHVGGYWDNNDSLYYNLWDGTEFFQGRHKDELGLDMKLLLSTYNRYTLLFNDATHLDAIVDFESLINKYTRLKITRRRIESTFIIEAHSKDRSKFIKILSIENWIGTKKTVKDLIEWYNGKQKGEELWILN